jgi:prepilin-type N-terminal cleavage/methylation domain-containing protein
MHKRSSRGFTLIELLVVIAIIGILAGIVLAALGNTRQQGADAGIKGNLDTIRTQAEVYASGNGNSYGSQSTTTAASGSSCGSTGMFADPTIAAATKAAAGNGTSGTIAGATGVVACGSGSGWWTVAAILKTDSSQTWCVDSTGQAKQVALSSIATAANFKSCP